MRQLNGPQQVELWRLRGQSDTAIDQAEAVIEDENADPRAVKDMTSEILRLLNAGNQLLTSLGQEPVYIQGE